MYRNRNDNAVATLETSGTIKQLIRILVFVLMQRQINILKIYISLSDIFINFS